MELVRRGGELALPDELFASARRTEGAAVLVTGSPGTGKSALLGAFADRAAASAALVLTASASPAEAHLPLGLVSQLLSGAGRFGAARPYEGGGGPGVLHDALRVLGTGDGHRAGARDGPVVAVVDDVHHADEASARCLLYLCGRLTASGVLLVMSGQPHPALPLPLAELFRHARCVPLPLTTLPEDGVADFLREPGAGGMDPATARRLAPGWHRFTGGNPRLLHGLLDDHRDCEPVRPFWPVAATAFRRAVTGCLRGDEAVTRTAHALAVLADDAPLILLARFLKVPERAVGPCLNRLEATGLLTGGRLRHGGVRAAILEDLSAEESRRLHSRAARVLYEDGAEPPVVAEHLVAADDEGTGPDGSGGGAGTGPAWAPPLLAEAARQAMRSAAPRRAARFLRVAAHGAGGDRPLRGGMLEMLARAEWESDPAAVIRHLHALERDLAAGRFDVAQTVAAAGLLLWHGRLAQAARAVAASGKSVPARELRTALAHIRPGTAEPLAAAGLDAVAERVLESVVHGHAPPPSVAAVLTMLVHAGETARAPQWCALSTGDGRAQTTPARRAVTAAVAAVVTARTQAYDAAAEYAGQARPSCRAGAWGVAIGMPRSAAVRVATARGAHEEAARLLRVAVPEAMFRCRFGLHYLLARGGHLLTAGRPAAALGDFHACRDLLAEWSLAPVDAVDWREPAAEALRQLGGGGPDGDPAAVLTRAERRVAVLAADGCTNRAIAARLYVTPSTVEQHLPSVYRKLRVRSRAELTQLVGAAQAGRRRASCRRTCTGPTGTLVLPLSPGGPEPGGGQGRPRGRWTSMLGSRTPVIG